MKSKLLLGAILVLACCCIAACSTSNSSNLPNPGWDREGFSLATEQGVGSFTPEMTVDEQATGATVTIKAKDARDLAAAYVKVLYDTRRYTPDRVEISDFMGREGEYISLALTNRAEEVPIGIAQIPSSGVAPRNGTGLLATVHFRNEPFVVRTTSAQSPSGSRNAVTDLSIVTQTATSANLRWTEKNVGDYDNNSEVSISDLTPIGQLFNQSVGSAADPVWAAMVDGDGNGLINLGDITPIGQCYGSTVTGFCVYTDGETGSECVSTGITTLRPSPLANPHAPAVYTYGASFTAGSNPQFAVRPVCEQDQDSPGPVSNVAEIINEPGPPADPTGLTATANVSIGQGNIRLDWTRSTSSDVGGYEIERKLSSDATWTLITVTAGNASTYTDTGLLKDTSYDYHIRADDFESNYSLWVGPATAEPYFPGVSPPKNVNAVASTSALSIDVTWEAPDDFSAMSYTIYRRAPGDPGFSELTAGIPAGAGPFLYSDAGLQPNSTYEYYVTSVAGPVESAESNHASATTTDVLPLTIDAVDTDKCTHLTDGSEGVAHLSLTTTPTATSITWSGPGVFSDVHAANPTWHPDGSEPLGLCQLSVTADAGGPGDTETLNMYITDSPILTTRGSGGHWVEWGTIPSFLEANVDGGGTVDGRPFAYYGDAKKVVWFNLFGLW